MNGPIPEVWSRPREGWGVADEGEVREKDLSLARLLSIARDLAMTDGTVHARIGFARERKQPVADIEVRARLPLRCQRCLQPMWLDVDQQSRVWLVTDLPNVGRQRMGPEPTLGPASPNALAPSLYHLLPLPRH